MKRNYKKEKIVIIGLGATGLSCLNFFLMRGVIPKVIDTQAYLPIMHKLPYDVPCCFGKFNDIWILNATLIVVSPGVKLDQPILVEAIKLGIEIIGDIELFVRETNSPIIAITGSNGKSTVTQLVGEMARCASWKIGVAGNIGMPVLNVLDKQCQLYILELSSFQLDTVYSLTATVATILNISVDHMDRYPGGLQQYIFSKKKIYRNAIICVINYEDYRTMPEHSDNYKHLVSFSANSNQADYHLEYYKRCIWIVAYNKYLINCSVLKIKNHVNYINMLSALAISDSINVPRAASIEALKKFSGLPHRFQLVYKNYGVSWINDSKATNVGATYAAINNTMTIISGRLHLLLGGDSKQSDCSILKVLIKRYDIDLYCFGKDGLFLTELGYKNVFFVNTMKHAIYIIKCRVQRKDIVLLSPACSSLDQFLSFKERGNIFAHFACSVCEKIN